MLGFRTARALVLDNEASEALPIIEALGALGIGVVYNSGRELHSSHKLNGMRPLFLDMVLDGFTPDDPANCVNGLISVLSGILEDCGDPAVLVCWTDNKGFIREVRVWNDEDHRV